MPHDPIRMCVVCRQRFVKTELLRHVRGADGKLMPDKGQTMPGRGWYVCSHTTCMEKMSKYTPGMPRRKGVKK